MEKKANQGVVATPIGYVKANEQQGDYAIEILAEFRPALTKLDQFGHVMIIWWADRHDNAADRKALVVDLPYAPGQKAGVFACRSEYRPNPIAITIMSILAVDEGAGVIRLPWIDAVDGTPVLDLKPYMPVSDRIRDVKVASWLDEWPLWMEEAGEYFATHDTDFG